MKTRNWSIRSKIIAVLAAPLAALLALWIFATVLTVGPAVNLLSTQTLLDTVGGPGDVLVMGLQHERRHSVVYLATRQADGRTLADQRVTTDRAVVDFRRAASKENARESVSELLHVRIGEIFSALDSLAGARGSIDRREVDSGGAYDQFSAIIDTILRMFIASAAIENQETDRQIRAITTVGRGREWLSQGDALLAGAHTAGRFTGDTAGRLIQAIGTQRFLYADSVADLPAEDRAAYQRLLASPLFVRLQGMQDTLVRSSRAGAAPSVTAEAWQPTYEAAVHQLRAFEARATEALAARATPAAMKILLRLAIAGILGLSAVVVSLIVSIRVGHSLIGRLRHLRAAALLVAEERLPSVVRRLQHGETVDVAAEVPALEFGTDEIGEVARAFTEVQRTAVQSAVDEAMVRRGLNEVFLNIARRSQGLLHRQLSLLDRMERRAVEPRELEDLYRIDHLATRMRRHAEDLVILAGATPGRGWRNPVPVFDVIRGAISEVEDYKRLDVAVVEPTAVQGRAVGDVIHLLAELLENAASFSPPHTRVQISGQVVPNGYAIEVEDRGLGMSPEALAAANRRLVEPPDFDPADSARLGLFVVAQLATRHTIKVRLRASPYGGVTAVALLPADLITAGQQQAALTAGPLTAGAPVGPPPVVGPSPVVGPPFVVVPPFAAPPAPRSAASGEPADGHPDVLAQRRRTGSRTVGSRQRGDVASGFPGGPSPVRVDVGGDGLPRRRRQPHLAAAVREPVADPEAATPSRSPEQVRALMSALQSGTARGRRAAREAAGRPESADWFLDVPATPGPRPGTTWADAATVDFPVVPAGAQQPGAAAGAATLVHHGEVLPRQPAGPGGEPPPGPTLHPAAPPVAEPSLDKDA